MRSKNNFLDIYYVNLNVVVYEIFLILMLLMLVEYLECVCNVIEIRYEEIFLYLIIYFEEFFMNYKCYGL